MNAYFSLCLLLKINNRNKKHGPPTKKMSSSSLVRPTKRRREDLDDKIEAVSKVINSMTGSKKTFLQAKLNNLKLKKQKLLALTCCRSEEPGAQNLVTEFEVMITENDIDIEIESIRSCKKFKRSENKYFQRLYRDSCAKENKSCSTSSELSPHDLAKITKCPEKSEAHNDGQDTSNASTENKVQCNKSTNTEPLYIIHAKKYVLGLEPIGESTKEMRQSEGSSFHDKCNHDAEKLLEQFEAMPYSKEPVSMKDYLIAREEFVAVQEKNPENIIQSEKHKTTLRTSDQSSIQSTWFENSFEIENASDKTDANQPHLPDNPASKSTATQYKPKTYENKNKVPSVLQNHTETISEQNSFASTTHIDGTKDTEVASRSTISTLPKTQNQFPEPALSQVTVTPSSTNFTPAKATNMEFQNSLKTEPKDTEIEAIHSHSLIEKLFGNYKSIYSPEKDSNNLEKPIPSVQNDANNNNDDKMILTTNTDLAEPNKSVSSETNYTINYLNSEETLWLSDEPSKINKDCGSKDMQPNSSQKNNLNNLKYEEWLNQFRQGYSDKISQLSANSQQISNKCMENSAKFQNSFAISKDSSAKCQDEPIKLLAQKLPTKSKDLVVKSQDLSSKSHDLPVKCQDRPNKSQDRSAKSLNQADRTQVQPDKSQDRSIKSQDRPNKSQERSVKSQDRSAKSQDRSAKSQDRPDKSRDRSVKIQDRPTKSQDQSAKIQDRPAKSQDQFSTSQNGLAKTQAQSATSQKGLAETQDRSDKSQDRTHKSQKLPSKCQDRPAEFQDSSVKYQKLSVKYQDYCAKLQYTQDLHLKSSPNSKILDKKSHKNSEKDKSKKRTKESEKALSYKTELVKDSAKMERIMKHSSAKNSDKSLNSSAKKSKKKGHDSSAKHLEKGHNSSAKNLEKNVIQTKEDLVNDLFKDLMASKVVKLDHSSSSSSKTISCHECGLVYEGHMCAYTIREILEQC